ncbi:hypothetical protein MG293_014856 [Ovis ammon polii]|uniref:Homeobox domain-containing protein n=1 Tax=Ovis ammon polii TaxID=230172 RepID=A0AAD4Y2U8_OVIAM|nr:hypothetical protein MG293_014856 [Ovis ammon polii]
MQQDRIVVFGPGATGSQSRRLILKQSQKDALQVFIQQNPYPGIATREWLTQELGIAESRVQETWPERPGERGQSSLLLKQGSLRKPSRGIASWGLPPGKNWLVRWEYEYLQSRPCRHRVSKEEAYSEASQKDALQALFQQNPYPGIVTRERLAQELGTAKSRVQIGGNMWWDSVVVFGPVSTRSLRRRLILKLSQKDALQVLFQQNPYPGIATRERLAQELALPKVEFRSGFKPMKKMVKAELITV